MKITIAPARGPADIATARTLFADYANWLARDHGISLDFQGIDAELAGLPGKYAPPRGEILLASDEFDAVIGCVALRPHEGDTCEVKRLYVLSAGRGLGVGRQLVDAVLEMARSQGYTRAILDTGPFMAAAQALYEACGFVDIPQYYDNPISNVRYMGRDL